jgi:hypothetical protein
MNVVEFFGLWIRPWRFCVIYYKMNIGRNPLSQIFHTYTKKFSPGCLYGAQISADNFAFGEYTAQSEFDSAKFILLLCKLHCPES